jgi:hypothetical protein
MSDQDTQAPEYDVRVGSTYSSNDKRQEGKVFSVTAVDEANESATLSVEGGKDRDVSFEKLESGYTLVDKARRTPGRPAREINAGSIWKRRSDGAEAKVIAIDEDADPATITLEGVASGKQTNSKLLFFRRRFEYVSG